MRKLYATPKTNQGLKITGKAWEGLKTLSSYSNLSRAEFLERLGRGMFTPSELQEIYKKFLDRVDR